MKKKQIDATQTTLEICNVSRKSPMKILEEVVRDNDVVLRKLNRGSKKFHSIKQPIKEETPEPFEMWRCKECGKPCPRPLSFCSTTCLQEYKQKGLNIASIK